MKTVKNREPEKKWIWWNDIGILLYALIGGFLAAIAMSGILFK